MPLLDRGTHHIHYDVHGSDSAPPLIMIMGLAFSSRAWDGLPARLAEHFRVITFDNRGAGKSTLPSGLFRIRDMAGDAVAILDDLAIDRAHVFGISMGGMIALELALTHPLRVRGLALGCTHAGYLRSKKPGLSVFGKLVRGAFFDKQIDAATAASFLISEDSYKKDPAAFAAWVKKVDRAGPRVAFAQIRAILRHAAHSRLSHVTAPTIVITGDDDKLVPHENSHVLAKNIRGARLVSFPGVGHSFPFEREVETASVITAFFSGISDREDAHVKVA